MKAAGEKLQIRYYDQVDLEMHPANMRLVPDDGKLQELAASILEQGIIQPLVGVPDGHKGRIQIVVGNRRLKATRLLGEKAPLVPVIVRNDLTERGQLEMMGVENLQRVDVDPVSEGLHYRRLMEEYGVSQTEIARRMGKCVLHVKNRLELLRLQPPVQRLIASGQLPIGAGTHLLRIEDPKLQSDVAIRLADMGLCSLDKIEQVAKRVQAGREERSQRRRAPRSERKGLDRLGQAMEKAGEILDGEALHRSDGSNISPDELNTALQATCAACQVGQVETPFRWADMLRATEHTCTGCGLSDLQDACDQCPLVEMLVHLRRQITVGA